MYSSSTNSDSLREYEQFVPGQNRVLIFDLYANGTVLAKSDDAQSACTVRMRASNIKGQSNTWHEVGIALVLHDADGMASSKLFMIRAELF